MDKIECFGRIPQQQKSAVGQKLTEKKGNSKMKRME
jgi:hypothetical protein